MIENERQYAITKEWAEHFEKEVLSLKSTYRYYQKGIDPQLVQAEIAAMESQAKKLRDEMREWETRLAV